MNITNEYSSLSYKQKSSIFIISTVICSIYLLMINDIFVKYEINALLYIIISILVVIIVSAISHYCLIEIILGGKKDG